jgi:hypothetical protein
MKPLEASAQHNNSIFFLFKYSTMETQDDGLTTEQKALILGIPDEGNKRNLRQHFLEANKREEENNQRAKGTYWTRLEQLYDIVEVPFENGYNDICLRMTDAEWKRPIKYDIIVEDLKKHATLSWEEISLETAGSASGNSSSQNSAKKGGNSRQNKGDNSGQNRGSKPNLVISVSERRTTTLTCENTLDFMGSGTGNKAHIIPHPRTLCAPRFGIIAQPILGFDFEHFMRDDEDKELKLKRILQKAIINGGRPHGLASLPQNLIWIPKAGHENRFDKRCQWFVIPVMTLEEALGWKDREERENQPPKQQSYEVMVIAGTFSKDEGAERDSILANKELIDPLVLEGDGHRLLGEKDIEKATQLLRHFVKALADMATGRGGNRLMPDGLDRENRDYSSAEWQDYVAEIQQGKESLEKNMLVKVPNLTTHDCSKLKVVGVQLKSNEDYRHTIPDPALLALKSGINWMAQMEQRPLPCCVASYEKDSDKDSDDEQSSDNEDWFSPGTPKLPEFVQFSSAQPVTPSPPRQRSSASLESDDDDEWTK